MGHARKTLDVEDRQRGVGDGLAEDRAGGRTEGGLNRVIGGVGIDIGHLDAQLFERDAEEVSGAAVDRPGGDEVVAAAAEVEDRDQRRGLARSGHQRADAAFQRGDLVLDRLGGGVAEPGVEVAGHLQVEEVADKLAAVVFEGRALKDGQHARLAVFRLPAGLDAQGV